MYDTNIVKKIGDYVLGKRKTETLIIGIAGPQGGGKSTLSVQLKSQIEESGIPCTVICIDDFYYTRARRIRLGETIHPLFSTRGPPGTHDIEKLIETIHAIKENSRTVTWPTFNKALDDRAVDRMVTFTPTPDRPPIIIFEGWCVGCLPTAIQPPINQLETEEDPQAVWREYVNEQIKTRYMPLWNMIDIYMYIAIPDWTYVYIWRHQQSISNRETSVDLDRFIQFFERISRSMMEPSGRIRTDVLVRMAPDHSIAELFLR